MDETAVAAPRERRIGIFRALAVALWARAILEALWALRIISTVGEPLVAAERGIFWIALDAGLSLAVLLALGGWYVMLAWWHWTVARDLRGTGIAAPAIGLLWLVPLANLVVPWLGLRRLWRDASGTGHAYLIGAWIGFALFGLLSMGAWVYAVASGARGVGEVVALGTDAAQAFLGLDWASTSMQAAAAGLLFVVVGFFVPFARQLQGHVPDAGNGGAPPVMTPS